MRHHESLWACRCVGALAVTLVEALDTSTSIDKLLLTSEEWVALVAEFKRDWLIAAAARREGVAARALDLDFVVLRMSVDLHVESPRNRFRSVSALRRRESWRFRPKIRRWYQRSSDDPSAFPSLERGCRPGRGR